MQDACKNSGIPPVYGCFYQHHLFHAINIDTQLNKSNNKCPALALLFCVIT
jgi:hypothetical protein